jgi:hypothetical protein
VGLEFSEIFIVGEVLVGVIEVIVVRVASLSCVQALKVAEKIPILCEFFCRDIILILLPLLLYLLIEGILTALTAYFLSQRHEVIDPAF